MKNSLIVELAGITLAVFAVLFVAAPVAHADDDFGGPSIDSCCGDMGGSWITDSVTPFYEPSYSYDSGSWITDSATPYYDPGYGTDPYGYGSLGYSTGGYMTGGYISGGLIAGGVLTGGGYLTTPVVHTGSSQPSVSNTCTAPNTCNTTTVVDDHSVVNANTTINAPTTITTSTYTPPTYNPPVCSGCGCYGSYCPPTVYTNPPVVAYSATPYIALSSAPYTGLELGFWGTVAYWGFLVLWCLIAAYLIVVKKVQNKILSYLNGFLFGTPAVAVADAHALFSQDDLAKLAEILHGKSTEQVVTHSKPAQESDEIDSFVLSQINRSKN